MHVLLKNRITHSCNCRNSRCFTSISFVMKRKRTEIESDIHKRRMKQFARIRLSGKKLMKCLKGLKEPSYQFELT